MGGYRVRSLPQQALPHKLAWRLEGVEVVLRQFL